MSVTCAVMKTASEKKQREVTDATIPITFVIRQEHVALATCGDPANCVVAQAMKATFGDVFDGMEVGSSITKVYLSDRIIRYATPHKISRQIPVFDKTGTWELPFGEYTFNPPSKSAKLGARPNRWKRVSLKKTTAGRDMFGARELPTRRATNLKTLAHVK